MSFCFLRILKVYAMQKRTYQHIGFLCSSLLPVALFFWIIYKSFFMSSNSKPAKGINCFVLPFIIFTIYLLTWISFSMYESAYVIYWFYIGYVLNAIGILAGGWAIIPQLLKHVHTSVSKYSFGYFQLVLQLSGQLIFSFVFIVLCDQWNMAQPYTGQSITLLVYSTAIMLTASLFALAYFLFKKKSPFPSKERTRSRSVQNNYSNALYQNSPWL